MTRVIKKLGLIFAALLLVVSSLPLLNAQSVKAADSTDQSDATIKIGTTQSLASLPFYVAQEKQFYQEHNITVELQQFKSAGALNDAIKAGSVNAAVTDLVNFTTIAKNNKSWKVTGTLTGYNGLVANKKDKNIKSLKGKTIALDKKDGSKLYLKNLLKKNNMKLSDVKIKNIAEQGKRTSSLKSKKVDAAVVADPFISNAKKSGAKVLNKQKASNTNGDVIAINNDYASKHVTDVNNLFNSYQDATKNLNKQGLTPSDSLLVQLGATRNAAADMNSLDITFKKARRVTVANFDKAVNYSKAQKLIKSRQQLSEVQLKVDKVTK
ncbi:ABC transporter substrate-binding protein [Companilactobacillus sp.]|jgi:NitT/TauT family transport system substrate-binding protein|uniref:ABC transporter substrate-binding protein n=1 Tax=Companilactobacillus sp. TaxID=2767905 RepID=UPI0025BC13E7|nr:ABC transporter substrate-binding protein [Companilactobacillus sp.]MCH4010082.1 ABC transporter substrate-binding protein [Companilactobacillus sp.]MCH4052242.1 ABC transporter substrate-binding protein [Companilactobacillus sp.]MCH4078024.1 ABC transporter substrate-binding protein [Companilactobacillus sp.]MCH4126600.1 ABC transporter substrate-binding protein [Companilactobacillus sp.]MCH4132185.1 ABC transporter substrate-binding protein [Companilactobacillus sp.]